MARGAGKKLKVLAIGDPKVGKTALLKTFAEGEYPGTDVPRTNDVYSIEMTHDAVPVELEVWDMPGEHERP